MQVRNEKAKPKRKSADVVWINAWLKQNFDQIEKKTGLTVLDPKGGLGCGAFGCVYATDDPRWVVKITRDKTEGPLVQSVVDYRARTDGGTGLGPSKILPGIVFYKDIFQARSTSAYIDQRWQKFRPFVIVRENVQPMSDEDVRRMTWYEVSDIEKGKATPGLNVLMKQAERFHQRGWSEEEMTNHVVAYGEWLDRLEPEFPLVIDAMRNLFAPPSDLVLQDVHAYNVGFTMTNWGREYRPVGSVVIHDLGVTPPTISPGKFRTLNPLFIHREDE